MGGRLGGGLGNASAGWQISTSLSVSQRGEPVCCTVSHSGGAKARNPPALAPMVWSPHEIKNGPGEFGAVYSALHGTASAEDVSPAEVPSQTTIERSHVWPLGTCML